MIDITWLEAVLAVLAAYRITRLIVVDDFPPVAAARRWLLARYPTTEDVFYASEVEPYCSPPLYHLIAGGETDHQTLLDAGWPEEPPQVTVTRHGTTVHLDPTEESWRPQVGHPVGDLISCPWCIGFWISTAVVAWLVFLPAVWLAPWALSATVGFISQHLE